jgi:uncharacterized protein YbbC (DUF1343 family)
MTVAELALLFDAEYLPLARWGGRSLGPSVLLPVPMAGWTRGLRCTGGNAGQWIRAGLPWVPPSPNMPTCDTGSIVGGSTCVSESQAVVFFQHRQRPSYR